MFLLKNKIKNMALRKVTKSKVVNLGKQWKDFLVMNKLPELKSGVKEKLKEVSPNLDLAQVTNCFDIIVIFKYSFFII